MDVILGCVEKEWMFSGKFRVESMYGVKRERLEKVPRLHYETQRVHARHCTKIVIIESKFVSRVDL
jgi:hypothetical protein